MRILRQDIYLMLNSAKTACDGRLGGSQVEIEASVKLMPCKINAFAAVEWYSNCPVKQKHKREENKNTN